MDLEKLSKGISLQKQIERLKKDVSQMDYACSEKFERRVMGINIFGNAHSPDGNSFIPASISKEVCNIILLSLESDLQKAVKEFESL